METQPTVLILSFISPPFTGTLRPWPLETYTVTLLLVGLHWWALYVNTFEQRGEQEERRVKRDSSQQVRLLRLLGLGIAYAAVLLTHISLLSNIFQLLLAMALVTWFWKRGLDKARPNLADEQLLTTFRIGFIALLILLLITFLTISLDSTSLYLHLLAQFGNTLPIFFLSGLLALSFTRLAAIRRENARSSLVSTVDPTRNWLIVLTLLWGVVVALTFALETFSFNTLADMFTPVWNILGLLVSLLLYLIFIVLGPLFSFLNAFFAGYGNRHLSVPTQLPPSKAQPPTVGPTLPPEVYLIGRIILLMVLFMLLILAIHLILKRWHARFQDENEEEVREGLPIRSILQARRQEQQRQQKQEPALALEVLDPHSARARYRELLQALAWNSTSLVRRPAETPTEYQARLMTQIKASSHTEQDKADTDPELLEDLTQAYIQERYGGKQPNQQQTPYSSSWIAQLVKRLTGR